MPIDVITDLMQRLGGHWGEPPRREREPLSPLERIERVLHPWVAFVIMPVFALANAGVAIDWAALVQPVTLAVAFGLIVGKPIGIVSFSWLAIRLGVTRLSPKINFPVLWGAGCLAGIGFTMSLFIASLALDPVHLVHAKVGILGGSTISAIVGCGLLLRYFKPKTGLSASR